MSSDPLAPSRSRLLGLAYRMLGSRSEAEDVLQDAYLRLADAEPPTNLEAFLVTIVTRLCLDRLKSARARREVYVGPWLPEPILDADALSPHAATELADDLSFALMLALERLNPAERAAFLLHACSTRRSPMSPPPWERAKPRAGNWRRGRARRCAMSGRARVSMRARTNACSGRF